MSQGLKNKITIYRFVLIFFVISIHTWNLSVYGIEWGISAFGSLIWFVESYFNTLETVCVPFFFVISGYLFFREFKLRSLPYKWKSRFRTVVIPYFL